MAAIVALGTALFIFANNPKGMLQRLFLLLAAFFSLWLVCDVVLWATNRPDVVMFLWSLQIFLEPLTYATAFYLYYYFVHQKWPGFWVNIFVALLLTPLIIFLPTYINLEALTLSSCEAVEGPLAKYYTYIVHTILMIGIVFVAIKQIPKLAARKEKLVALFFGVGLIIFLLAFSSGNIISSFTDDWVISQYGLFGMPIFVAFIAYSIVKFQAFDIKLFATQVLVAGITILIGARLFYSTTITGTVLSIVTLICFLVSGFFLIRSVKREIEQREQLEIANKGQENLIHIMNHQIKGYLSVAKNVFAELLEGTDYGQMPETSKPLLSNGLDRMNEGVEYIQNILKGASAQSGKLPYDIKPMDLKQTVANLVSQQKEIVEKAGLSFESNIADGDYNMNGDATLLEESFKNIITNAVKYNNPNGKVAVSLLRTGQKILFSVKDAGKGISKDDEQRLFKPGGMGRDSMKYNADASGFGLSFVKPVIEKHQGSIWFKSNSPEQGTTFFVELPVGAKS